MRLVDILMLITSIIWIVASVYLIYSIGRAILALSFAPAITGILIFAFASVAELFVAILTE